MREYDAYLFDWDGTLANTFAVWLNASEQAYAEFGVQVSRTDIAKRLGVWELMWQDIPEDQRQAFKQRVDAIAYPLVQHAPLYEGAEETLKTLAEQGKKLALITAASRELMDLVLEHRTIVQYFDLILTVDDVKIPKPDPEGILAALQHLGVSAEKAVMFGDSDKDLGAAQNAGVDSALFYPEEHELSHDREHLDSFKPVAVLHSWSAFNKEGEA